VSDPIVGIDLGTSNTVVAYADVNGQVRVLADEAGYKIHPSVVSFHPSGGVVVGAPAKQRKVIDPKNTIYSVKRLIGRSYNSPEVAIAKKRMPYQIKEGPNQMPKVVTRGGEFAIPEISAIVLDHVRNIAATQLQTEVNRAVVTVPASFNDVQRSATATAGAVAGMTVVRVLNEPTAAALAYGHSRNLRQIIAVYDFGGGTFDITILKLEDQVYEVLGTGGDTFLGGDDLDERLVDKMVDKFLADNRIDLRTNEISMMRLRAVAEQTKIELSRRSRAVVRIDEIAYGPSGKPLDLQIEITRDEFVRQVADIIDRTFPVCQDAMQLAGLGLDRIDDVILVGGTTKIPYVRDQVSRFFAKAPRTDVNPEDAVAIGAALQATALERILARKPSREQPTVSGSDSFPDMDTETRVRQDDTFSGTSQVTAAEAPGMDTLTLAPVVDEPTSDGSGPPRQTGGYDAMKRSAPRLDPKETLRPVERGAQIDRIEERTPIPGAPPALPSASQPIGRLTKPQGSTLTGAPTGPAPSKTAPGFTRPPPMPAAPPSAAPTPVKTAPSVPVQRPPAPPAPPPPPPMMPQMPVAPPQARTLLLDPHPPQPPPPLPAAQARTIMLDPQPPPPPPMQRTLIAPEPAPPPAPSYGYGGGPGDANVGFADPPPARGFGTESETVESPASTAKGFVPPQTYPVSVGARGPVVMDVTPRGLGIATVAGYCEELIRRNSRVPAEIRKLFTTSRDGQDVVRILVCQGESRRIDHNVVIGDLVLGALPPRPRGETSIEVTFMLDASGILQVRARDAQTGQEQRASIEVIGTMSQDEIAESRERMQQMRR
jgi:molecular chaperone DnaK